MAVRNEQQDGALVIEGPIFHARFAEILNGEALGFLEDLARVFTPRIQEALELRAQRLERLAQGAALDFLPETAGVRAKEWKVAPLPHDLLRRVVEITGPTDRKMVINALNSGADVFMADFEDANSPTWENLIEGQLNLRDAVRRKLSFDDPSSGKQYRLNERTAVLIVRPRGLHLPERHVTLDGAPIPGSLLDFGLYFFHNAHELLARGTGPYFYLPKLESHLEARIWNDVFLAAEDALRLEPGTIKAALDKVRADKLREVRDGHDGTWVAHPGLVPIAREVFEANMSGPNQLDRLREDVRATAADLLQVPAGTRTEEGLRLNVRVGIQYIEAWLRGNGCVPLYSLMEDAATAEISRAQVWQWLHHGAALTDGRRVTPELIGAVIDDEMVRIEKEIGSDRFRSGRFPEARALFEKISTAPKLETFLTLPAYEALDRGSEAARKPSR